MIMGKEDYERIIGKLRERAEKMEGVVNPLMTRLGVDYLGLVLPTVSAIIAERDRLKDEVAMLEDALLQFRNADPTMEDTALWQKAMEGQRINPLACPRCGTPVDDRGGQCACEEDKP